MIQSIIKNFRSLVSIGISPTDTPEIQLKKRIFILLIIITGSTATFACLIYILFDHFLLAIIPFSYIVISIINLWHLSKTKNIAFLKNTQLLLLLTMPFILMWSLGGFAMGGFVFIWAFFSPIVALIYSQEKKTNLWFFYFFILILFSVIIDDKMILHHYSFFPKHIIDLFFIFNVGAGLSGIYFLISYFIDEKEKRADFVLQKEHEILLERTQELKVANNQLKHLAMHDNVTNLPNRLFFKEHISKMIAHSKRNNTNLALMFLDLDGFKKINDNHGHAIGDEVLQMVSQRIKYILREEDLIARFGGDEFSVMLIDITDMNMVKAVAKRVIEDINKEYRLNNITCNLGVSIGISIYPEHGENIENLIHNADAAMYKVKMSGKNNYHIYSEGL